MTDAELVAACLAGKKDAWDAFVERYGRLVRWAARRALEKTAFARRVDVADDAFQDVFRSLLERSELERLRDSKSLPAFLSVMACHAALDRAKSLARAEKRALREDPETGSLEALVADPGEGPRDRAAAGERDRLVAAAVEALPARERACVRMHYLEGLTHREIAETLGLPQDTVSTVIRRTRGKLKSDLEARGLDGS